MDLFGDNSDSEVEPFSTDFVPPAPILKPHVTSTTFSSLLPYPLKIYEDLAKGCGGQIWPAGELLTEYLLRRYGTCSSNAIPGGLKGKRIVELGAGGGITGLAMAIGCDLGEDEQGRKAEMWITDMEAMMGMIRKNVELNEMEGKVEELLLDWAEPVPEVLKDREVDVVIAADCVYFEPAFPLLEKTLVELVGEKTVVYFCFKKRRRADLTFMKAIKKRLNVREVKDDPEFARHDEGHEKYSRENLYLYIMTKKT